MEKEIVKEFIISKGDLERYFNNRDNLTADELEKYYMEKNVINFNAIFNATPR